MSSPILIAPYTHVKVLLAEHVADLIGPDTHVKVLRAEHVADLTGLPRRSIVEKHIHTSNVYDSSFPPPLRLTPKGSLGWLEAEVIRWIQSRPRVGGSA